MQEREPVREESHGFALVELLVVIVVVGVLTAVAIVGISGLSNNGAKSACATTGDAVKEAQALFYSNHSGTYPTSFDDLLTDSPRPELELKGSTDHPAADQISGSGWTLTSFSGGGTAPMTWSAC